MASRCAGVLSGLLFLCGWFLLPGRAAVRAQVADVARAHQAGLNVAVGANRAAAMIAANGFFRRLGAAADGLM